MLSAPVSLLAGLLPFLYRQYPERHYAASRPQLYHSENVLTQSPVTYPMAFFYSSFHFTSLWHLTFLTAYSICDTIQLLFSSYPLSHFSSIFFTFFLFLHPFLSVAIPKFPSLVFSLSNSIHSIFNS